MATGVTKRASARRSTEPMSTLKTPSLLPNLPTGTFVRTVWHSEADRKRYEYVLANYSNAWLEAEQMSVLEGIRPLCLQPLSQPEYLAFLPWAHDNGLHVRVKRFAGAFQGFAHYYTEGSDILVRSEERRVGKECASRWTP